jgi:glycosyltransferase involved in cell wall biosynthesis
MSIPARIRAAAETEISAPAVEIVVPVRDEARVLAASVRRLHGYLSASFPFSFRITIADNGSSDGTWKIAQRLADELAGVESVRIDLPGRGRALSAVWSHSDAAVLAYMDVDLSTDLAALLPLVAPLLSGHSDLAIGSRLARGARVVRGPKRELISRAYNTLLHTGGTGTGGGRGAGSSSSAVASWVEQHFASTTSGGVTVYDLTATTS